MSKGAVKSAVLEAGGKVLSVGWQDGTSSRISAWWLRDHLPGNADGHSGQRFVDVMDLPADPLLQHVEVIDSTVLLDWQDGVKASFATAWLAVHAVPPVPATPKARLWLKAAGMTPTGDFSRTSLAALRDDDAVRARWLEGLLRDGLAFLHDVPRVEGTLLEAMAIIGTVPETNYGYVFDVRAVPQPENLAYSDLGLGLHTDNPYREPVPGYQALHTLVAAPDGGDSLFTDGFAIAEHLRATDPAAFALLTRVPVRFEYLSSNACLEADRPLIELGPHGEIDAVSYNNRSIRPPCLEPEACEAFYAAYRQLAALLREDRFQMRTRLENGELVVFDNRRVLHGRTAFSSARFPRHLQGCYLTRDSVHSTAGLLRRRLAC